MALAASPMVATTATAQEAATVTRVANEQVPKVPTTKVYAHPQEVVRTISARSSVDGIAVTVYGDSEWLLNDAKFALYEGHLRGYAVKGIVRGNPADEDGIDIYVDGQRIAEDSAPREGVREAIVYALEYGQDLLDNEFSTDKKYDTASAPQSSMQLNR